MSLDCWESRRLLGLFKTRGEIEAQCSGTLVAAVPRLLKTLKEAVKAATPIRNATLLEADDRAASAQLYDSARKSEHHRQAVTVNARVQDNVWCHPEVFHFKATWPKASQATCRRKFPKQLSIPLPCVLTH